MENIHAIYKYVYQNEIIYIGKTDRSIRSRIDSHAKDSKFNPYKNADIYYFTVENSTETSVYEKLLINKYQPVLNVVDKHQQHLSISFDEPNWFVYDLCGEEQKRSSKTTYNHKKRQISDGLKYRLLIINRELWMIGIFSTILSLKENYIIKDIPIKYRIDDLHESEQFVFCNSLLNGFSWITNNELRKYDICSVNQQRLKPFVCSYDGDSYRYKFSIADGFDNDILNKLCRRMLNGYAQYTTQMRSKAIQSYLMECELHDLS